MPSLQWVSLAELRRILHVMGFSENQIEASIDLIMMDPQSQTREEEGATKVMWPVPDE